jgi:hypothetical protein
VKGGQVVPARMKGIKELSKESGLTYSAIRKLCQQNKIVYIRIGAKFMINVEKFNEYLNAGDCDGS